MKKLFGKIKKYLLIGLLIAAVVITILPQAANAEGEGGIFTAIGATTWNIAKLAVASPIIIALGAISILVMGVVGALNMIIIGFIVNIVQYNNFVNEPSIINAWIIVRDLANMFFILILLVIAFATILRIESYQWKKLLPKLLIMAVLINFSRTICGLIIDFSQVIMLTFVNAFTAGNIVDMTQMANYFTGVTFDKFTSFEWSVLNVVIGLIIGIMFMIISGIVLLVAMAVFFMRIIMLWIYIVLSPVAFLAAAFPAGQKYASQWWSEFVRYIINGPVLAFFIWMALMTSKIKINFFSGVPQQCFGISKILCMENFMPYILSIGMLLGGLIITQQIGGLGASIAGKGLDWAKKAAKLVGGIAGYVPAQYAKKAGYGLGDMVLGRLKKAPIIGNLAIEGRARLKMHRDFAEEKDTKYMQYLEEQDLDKVIARQRSRGVISFLGKGMESKRQMFKRALIEKMKRGDEWGQTMEEKRSNKTRAMIDLAQIGGHSITSSGEDAFREADLLKLWHEFRNKNVGVIDDVQMRDYFFGGEGNQMVRGGARTGAHYKYKGFKGPRGAANSEYYRVGGWQDPNTGFWYEREDPNNLGQGEGFVSPNSMLAYTAMRQRMNEFHGLHHENFAPRIDAGGNLHYDLFDAVYDNGRGPMRSFAQVRDRGTRQQKIPLRGYYEYRINKESAPGYVGSTRFRDIYNDYMTYHPGHNMKQFLDAAMMNGGIRDIPNTNDIFGNARAIMGQTRSAEVASGITGLDRVNRGVMAANFSDLGLEKVAAKYFDGADKAKIASRISGSLRENGVAENIAKAIEEQINKASYLILHNKEAGVSGGEARTAHAHELMHARLGANFNQDEIKSVWDSMDDNSKNDARKQISAKWGGKMSEEAIMNEYFAEGLTAKTRWGKGAVLSLDKKAETSLDGLLKSKGSNITAFTSNVMATRPDSDQIRRSMVNGVDRPLQKTMEELISALRDVGNGFGSVEKLSENFSSLQRAMERNRTSLDKSVKGYKEVNDKLNNLVNKTT